MGKPLCLLLIHGFGGSAKEVAPLATHLEGLGVTVFIVKLAGHHGIDNMPIDNIDYMQWVNSVRVELRVLEKNYRVIPVGFSMGGLIAAVLNSEKPFTGMVFINTPIYFWNLPQVAQNLISDFKNAQSYYFKSAGLVTPYTMSQFLFLLRHARDLFKQINCPALVVQAQDDDSVWPSSADFICKNLQQNPEFYPAPTGSHMVLANPIECKIIAEKIATLCKQL